ncbi:hypothetical protein F7725_005511 [Dissostichus mawsoni]|uniref:G-patch domain-containing protein n=1 Tax=Dissostichus mawsoni TaxID=36200 RepID=A0A7J5YRL8_DISMA|nr:hypothetical protein F7725_005511 [Dissostichus mawsoni]
MELLGLRFLRCANDGDISGLKDLLSKGVDINFQDTYFWTAMMCASWSGQRAAVRLLLQHGAAWVGVVDTQGRDAKDLALEAGHNELLEELESYGTSAERDPQSDSSASQPQWCGVCCSEYSSSLSSHLSSTLHLFSLRRAPPTPYYCLPPSSNSYKMMVRCGWEPGTGLGPEGEGPKQPVPTVLKRDQEGLGYGHMKRAKVTHFQPRDSAAVKRPSQEKQEGRGKGERKEDNGEAVVLQNFHHGQFNQNQSKTHPYAVPWPEPKRQKSIKELSRRLWKQGDPKPLHERKKNREKP